MSDIRTNPELYTLRKEVKIEEMKLSIRKQQLRKVELLDGIATIDENIKAIELEMKKFQSDKEKQDG